METVDCRPTQRSATGARRRWRWIRLRANRLAPVRCTVWFALPIHDLRSTPARRRLVQQPGVL